MQSESSHVPLVISPRVRADARQRRRVYWVALLLVAAIGAVVLLVRGRAETPRYETAVVERRSLVYEVEVTGQVDAITRVEVPASVAGRLVKVMVREGEAVHEGQVLALLDGRALVIAARGARAHLDAAASRVAEALAVQRAATEARERTERLRTRELSSDSMVEEAKAREARAIAALASARADRGLAREGLTSAKLSESLSSITAPMAGVVLQAPAVSGASVSPERDPLFVIGSPLESVRVLAEVAESDVGELRSGQDARFSVPAYPGRSFAARVEHVGIDARRSAVAVRYPVELRASNSDHALLPGMTATATIAVARVENVLTTRDAALRFRPESAPEGGERTRLWRVTPRGLVEVRVTAGLSDGAHTEVVPEVPGALGVGTEVALGVLGVGTPKPASAGIRLGNR